MRAVAAALHTALLAVPAWPAASSAACIGGAGNASVAFELPASGAQVGIDYEVRFRLSGGVVPGSLRMIWASADDKDGPHHLTLSEAVSKPGLHSFDMQRFSLAVDSMDEVAAADSGGRSARDLVRGATYNVTLMARFETCADTNETSALGVSHSVERWDLRWVWGVCASLISSLGSTAGMLIQKCAITANEEKIELTGKGAPVILGFTCSVAWWLGFILMVLVPLPFDMISLALCGQSLNAPLGGVSVLLNQIIAPIALEQETMTRLDWAATFCIVLGVIVSTAFGGHNSPTYQLDELMDFFGNPTFLTFDAAIWFLGIFPGLWAIRYRQSWPQIHLVYAFLAGAIGSQQNILLKATSVLTEALFNGDMEAWDKPITYIMAASAFGLAAFQLSFLNKGLAISETIKYLPVYNACLILCSVFYGALYYQEYRDWQPIGYVLFPAGCGVVMFGVLLLSLHSDTGSKASKISAAPKAAGSKDVNYSSGDKPVDTGVGATRTDVGEKNTLQPNADQVSPGSTRTLDLIDGQKDQHDANGNKGSSPVPLESPAVTPVGEQSGTPENPPPLVPERAFSSAAAVARGLPPIVNPPRAPPLMENDDAP